VWARGLGGAPLESSQNLSYPYGTIAPGLLGHLLVRFLPSYSLELLIWEVDQNLHQHLSWSHILNDVPKSHVLFSSVREVAARLAANFAVDTAVSSLVLLTFCMQCVRICCWHCREVMDKSFHECYTHYESTCRTNSQLNGQPMQVHFMVYTAVLLVDFIHWTALIRFFQHLLIWDDIYKLSWFTFIVYLQSVKVIDCVN